MLTVYVLGAGTDQFLNCLLCCVVGSFLSERQNIYSSRLLYTVEENRMKSKLRNLNSLAADIMGKPMTAKEKRLLEELRGKVIRKEIGVAEGHRIWDSR